MEATGQNIYNLIILDESGSMSLIRTQAVSAMNETFQSVRKASELNPQNNYFISLVVFEGSGPNGVRTVRDRVPVAGIEDITLDEYVPGGCTPLYDAMGLSISRLSRSIMPSDPVMVTIITDGMENASQEYSGRAIKDLVAAKREMGWTFAYIGANQDSVEVAHELSIGNALNFDASIEGMERMSRRLHEATMRYACCEKSVRSNRGGVVDLFSDEILDDFLSSGSRK